MSSVESRTERFRGLLRTAVVVLGTLGCTGIASAQDAGSAGSGSSPAAEPSTPSSASPSGDEPILFSPNATAPISQFQLLQSINTPSGFAPFTGGPTTVPQGFHLSISESGRYDDNVFRLPDGVFTPARRSRGDFYSVSTVSGSASAQLGLQSVYVRGSYGLTRYRVDTSLNSDLYSAEVGINWRTGSACNGNLSVSTNQSELAFQDLAIGTARSLTTSNRVDFQGRCHLIDRFYGTYGATAQQFEVSSTPLNNYKQVSGKGGLEYALPKSYTVGVEAVYRDTDYTNRAAMPLIPLTTNLQQQDYRGYFRYFVSPKTTIELGAGIAQFSNNLNSGSREQTVPTYSASISWRPTPKLFFNAATSYSVSPATGVLSDYQEGRSTTVSAIYNFSPKIAISAVYGHSETTSLLIATGATPAAVQETVTDSASINMTYRVTSRLDASLGYRFSEQNDNLRRISSASNLYLIGLNYRR